MRGQLTLESDSKFPNARKSAMRALHNPPVFVQLLIALNAFRAMWLVMPHRRR